jgi:hypothetical protein
VDKPLLGTAFLENLVAVGLVLVACGSAHAQAAADPGPAEPAVLLDVPAPPTSADAATLATFQDNFKTALAQIVHPIVPFKGSPKIGMTLQQVAVAEKCITSPASCTATQPAAAAGTGSSATAAKNYPADPSLFQTIRKSEWRFVDQGIAAKLLDCLQHPTQPPQGSCK